ncbi:Ig alpha-1 chain C, partial [Tupaia chinensis]
TSPKAFPLHNLSPESEEHMEVACLIQGFFPEPANVSWSHSGDEVTIRTFPPSLAASDGLYTMTSQLTMPAAQCSKNSPPRCHVQHFSYQQDVAMSCPAVPPSCCEPRLSLHRPALEDLLLGSDASLTCTLSGLRDPKGATFTWQPTGGKDAVQGTPKLDSCGCYSVSSILPGCAEPWNSGEHFTCTATHPESTNQLTATIFKPSGNTFRPQVHLLPPPSEELALNELVTLTCLVRGFSPEDVLVRWLDGSQELLPKDYVTWAPQPEPGNSAPTFAVISMLRVAAERWKDGQKYSCVVGHEALPTAFTQKTIDRQAGIPTRVNVSVIVAEAEGVCY